MQAQQLAEGGGQMPQEGEEVEQEEIEGEEMQGGEDQMMA